MQYFSYDKAQTDYLSSRDSRLCLAINKIGHIDREVDKDVFTAVVKQIIAQQISNAALEKIWHRVQGAFGTISPKILLEAGETALHNLGLSMPKVRYILGFCQKVFDKEFDTASLQDMDDIEALNALTSLKGVGEWTAQMVLIFCLERQNIISYNDKAIIKGLKLLYNKDTISQLFFSNCKACYSPYSSVASLYLWEVAGRSLVL